MTLALYGHPLSSYTQKVLIALYENGTAFEYRRLDEDRKHGEALAARWPRFPLLLDGDRQIVESSIIIEYLQNRYPGPVSLIPKDPDLALEVRFLDRIFDLDVMEPTGFAVLCALGRLPIPVEEARRIAAARLEAAYERLERLIAGRAWAAGDEFTLADCAASSSLFYADWTAPIPERFPVVRAYRARLFARPSFARAVEEARPFRRLFPLGAPDRD